MTSKPHTQRVKTTERFKEMIPKSLNQVEIKKITKKVTGRAGLNWIEGSLEHVGFFEKIDELVPVKGLSNKAMPMSVKLGSEIVSRIDGSGAIEDVEVLRRDAGYLRIRGERIAGADTIRTMLNADETEHCQKAVNRWLVIEAMKRSTEESFTYDNDATYCESAKKSASYSYRETQDHSALLGFIVELGMCATMDFRTGNISPRTGIVEQLEESIAIAKEAGKRISRVRIDSAGHSNDVFNTCRDNDIEFYVTLAQNTAVKEIIRGLKEQDWCAFGETDREITESVYVTNEGASARMIVLRWHKKQGELFTENYFYHVVGTSNDTALAEEIIKTHSGRMGSENYNKELKDGYNCEWAPSHRFRMNANYFYAGVLACNCVEIVKRFFIGCKETIRYRIKRFRQWFIKICGNVIKTGRKYYFQVINVTDKSHEMVCAVWQRLQYDW